MKATIKMIIILIFLLTLFTIVCLTGDWEAIF